MQNKSLFKVILGFFGVAFLFFGLIFFVMYSGNVTKGRETKNWFETNGVIISSYLETETDPDHDNTYTAKIKYEYSVNGINYTGSRISYEIVNAADYNQAQNKVDKYYPGRVVTVYYDPNKPSESVLEKGFSGFPFFPSFISIIFFIIGIGFFIAIIILTIKEKSSGKLNIQIYKTNFKPGEEIQGKVTLSFKKQKHAKSLKLFLIGERVVVQTDRNGTQERSFTFYENEKVLSVEQSVSNETYNFQFIIPFNILQTAKNFNELEYGFVLNKQVKLSDRTASMSKKASKIMEWGQAKGYLNLNKFDRYYLKAVLEIPKGLDIKTKRFFSINE